MRRKVSRSCLGVEPASSPQVCFVVFIFLCCSCSFGEPTSLPVYTSTLHRQDAKLRTNLFLFQKPTIYCCRHHRILHLVGALAVLVAIIAYLVPTPITTAYHLRQNGDGGYIEASNLVESRREYDIDLIGPAQSNGRSPASTREWF